MFLPLLLREGRATEYFSHKEHIYFDRVDVVEYYTQEEVRLEKEVADLTEKALQSPLGYAFVTFDNVNSSKKVFDDYQRLFLSGFKAPKQSSLSASLKSNQWNVSFATNPGDLIWENLRPTSVPRYILIFTVDLVILLIGLFLTTPEVIGETLVEWVDKWANCEDCDDHHHIIPKEVL